MDRGRRKNILMLRILKDVIEAGFIIFLFYANLLMGEYTGEGRAWGKGLWWAVCDIFTMGNFVIAVVAAVAGHFVVQFLRKRF